MIDLWRNSLDLTPNQARIILSSRFGINAPYPRYLALTAWQRKVIGNAVTDLGFRKQHGATGAPAGWLYDELVTAAKRYDELVTAAKSVTVAKKNPRRKKLLGARSAGLFSAYFSPRAGTMFFSREHTTREEAAAQLFEDFPRQQSVSTQRGEGFDIRVIRRTDLNKNPRRKAAPGPSLNPSSKAPGPSLEQLRSHARANGMSVSRIDGEYRVAYLPTGNQKSTEASAYYTTDAADAWDTLELMAARKIDVNKNPRRKSKTKIRRAPRKVAKKAVRRKKSPSRKIVRRKTVTRKISRARGNPIKINWVIRGENSRFSQPDFFWAGNRFTTFRERAKIFSSLQKARVVGLGMLNKLPEQIAALWFERA